MTTEPLSSQEQYERADIFFSVVEAVRFLVKQNGRVTSDCLHLHQSLPDDYHRVSGAVFSHLCRVGEIKKQGHQTSKRKERKGGLISVYVKV